MNNSRKKGRSAGEADYQEERLIPYTDYLKAASNTADPDFDPDLDSSAEARDSAYSPNDAAYWKEQLDRNAASEETNRRGRRQKTGRSRKKGGFGKILIRILLVIVALLLALIAAFFILRYRGEQNLKKNVVKKTVEVNVPDEETDTAGDGSSSVVYKGERYWYNEDIITVLCMGIDREEFATSDDMVIGGNGQADADVLVIFDKAKGEISFLNISRDCMVDLDRYNIQGQYIDTVHEQLCLSFAFGNGKETSCENTALSVSRLLYGLPINAYVAIDFEGLPALTDAVGGVTVPVTEEIAEFYPDTPVGSNVTLDSSNALTYVRKRDISYLDSNNPRMARQKQFIIAFLKQAFAQIKDDPRKALNLFNSVSDNMVTSLDVSEVTYFSSFFAEHGFKEENMVSVQGQVVEGEDGFAEFIHDETVLYETVLDLFYTKE